MREANQDAAALTGEGRHMRVPAEVLVEDHSEVARFSTRSQRCTSEVDGELGKRAQILAGSNGEQFKLRYVNFETVAMKIVAERSESGLHASDKGRQVRFWFRNDDLSIIGVLHNECIRRMKTQVVREGAEQKWPQRRALEDSLLNRARSRYFSLAIRASKADTLSVTVQVILKPRGVDAEGLEFF